MRKNFIELKFYRFAACLCFISQVFWLQMACANAETKDKDVVKENFRTQAHDGVKMSPNKTQKEKIKDFHGLHHNNLLLLPNAWDAISAKIFEQEGAQAIGTTSSGIAAALGYPDGQRIPKDLFLKAVERIVSSVRVPVSIDLEAGYGQTVDEVCDTVQKVIHMGAVGINLEDTDPKTNQLIPLTQQVERIRAIRKLANENDLPLFINARTDVYWVSNIPPEKRYKETLQRLLAYKAAGADGLFVPGLTDVPLITKLCRETQLPLNILGGIWITSLDILKNAGVSRISIGSGIFRAATTYTQHAYRQFMRDDFSFLKDSISYDFINNLYK